MGSHVTTKVFQQLARCMNALVGGSRHLARYSLSPDTFQIVKVVKLGGGLTKYHFTARAGYESEFTVWYGDERDEEHIHSVSGSIVLDKDFGLVRDETGRVMLEHWRCVDPERSHVHGCMDSCRASGGVHRDSSLSLSRAYAGFFASAFKDIEARWLVWRWVILV